MSLFSPHFLRFFPGKLILNFATVGKIGTNLKAPGTWGAVIGLLWYTIFFYGLNFWQFFLLFFVSVWFAIAICGEAERIMGQKDSPSIILDEVVSMPLCFYGIEKFHGQIENWRIFLLGFLLFRFFDILKPLGIRSLQNIKGGLGIVIDDVVAALFTLICIHLLFLCAIYCPFHCCGL